MARDRGRCLNYAVCPTRSPMSNRPAFATAAPPGHHRHQLPSRCRSSDAYPVAAPRGCRTTHPRRHPRRTHESGTAGRGRGRCWRQRRPNGPGISRRAATVRRLVRRRPKPSGSQNSSAGPTPAQIAGDVTGSPRSASSKGEPQVRIAGIGPFRHRVGHDLPRALAALVIPRPSRLDPRHRGRQASRPPAAAGTKVSDLADTFALPAEGC